MDAIHKHDIETAFRGKLWAYCAVTTPYGFSLGVAVANEAGYSPIPSHWLPSDKLATWKDVDNYATQLNLARGMSDEEATGIAISSMAQGKLI